ncbi:MAG: HEAT repeat domain-containing protein [Bdellovibrionota bacterium]
MKLTSFLSLNACLTHNPRLRGAVIAVVLCAFAPLQSEAALATKKGASASAGGRDIASILMKDIDALQRGPFERQFMEWELKFGSGAVAPLTKIVGNARLDDSKRYVALMGIARLGGAEAAPILVPSLKDRSWLLRSGALKAISALGNASVAGAILPLVEDRALVVRVEAIEAIVRLRPIGSVSALTKALTAESNFRNGRALWVPRRALEALVKLGGKEAVPTIATLLSHDQDPELQASAIASLEALTGRVLEPGGTLVQKILAWKANSPKQN